MLKTIFLFLILLSACSGGGDGNNSQTPDSNTLTCSLVSDNIKIMPIGDSITEGESGHNTYRRALWQNLASTNCKIDFVGSKNGVRYGKTPPNPDYDLDHEGYWGYRVDQVYSFIQKKVIELQPDVTLIHLGSNDIFQSQSNAETINDIDYLINQIRIAKPDVIIFLAQIIPSRVAKDRIVDFNLKLESLASKLNNQTSPVILVDQYTNYEITDNYDGTHPNESGESKIADNWTNAILRHLSK